MAQLNKGPREQMQLGEMASRGARLPLIAWILMALGTAMVSLTTASIAIVNASYEGSIQRALSLVGNVVNETEATMLWRGDWGNLGTEAIAIHYLTPLREEAVPPIWLNEWPEPGSVLMSPALARWAESVDSLESYGPIVGLLPRDILATPTEKLLFIFPEQSVIKEGSFEYVDGLNGFYSPFSEVMNYQPIYMFLVSMLPFLYIGAFSLLVISARSNESVARVNANVLRLLGAPFLTRLWIAVRRVLGPILVGALISGVVLAMFWLVPVRLPLTGYITTPGDLRSSWLATVGLALLGLLIGSLLLLFGARLTSRRIRAGSFSRSGGNPFWAIVFIAVVVSIVPVSDYYSQRQEQDIATYLYWVQLIVILLTFPSFINTLAKLIGRLAAFIGKRSGRATWLISGRQMQSDPRSTARAVGTLMLTLLVVTQVQFWTATFNRDYHGIEVYQALNGNALVSTSVGEGELQEVKSVIESIGYEWISVRQGEHLPLVDGSAQVSSFLASSSTEEIEMNSAQGVELSTLRYALRALGVQEFTYSADQPSESSLIVMAVDLSTQSISKEVLSKELNSRFVPFLNFSVPGEGAMAGSEIMSKQARWISLFGTMGSVLLLLASGLGAANAALRSKEDTGPLSAIAAPANIAGESAALRVTVPTVIGFAAGIPMTYAVGYPHLDPDLGVTMPWGFLLVTASLALIGALSIARYVSRTVQARFQEWRPGDVESSYYE